LLRSVGAMVLGFHRLAGLRSSLLASHSPLRAAAASAMAAPRPLSAAMHAKAAAPTEDEVLGCHCQGFRV
jgi:hypothetical protein